MGLLQTGQPLPACSWTSFPQAMQVAWWPHGTNTHSLGALQHTMQISSSGRPSMLAGGAGSSDATLRSSAEGQGKVRGEGDDSVLQGVRF
jgi:hypothetical protein